VLEDEDVIFDGYNEGRKIQELIPHIVENMGPIKSLERDLLIDDSVLYCR
jgi:hypothetical protein